MAIPAQCPSWDDLQWSSSPFVRAASINRPLDIPQSPNAPGLYMMTWLGVDGWRLLPKHITVKATVKVQTPILDFSSLNPPLVLTIGRTTAIRKRIRQHFGTNQNNNRALMRFRQLLPDLEISELLEIICNNVRIDWVCVDNWVHRCLLEKAGVCNV
jgi:hypothetical protein